MDGALLRVWYLSLGNYVELTPPQGLREKDQWVWLDQIGLGLALWEGPFEEDMPRLGLRWCDQDGKVIPTGAEQAQQERRRADRLAELLRQQGIDPETLA